MSDTIEVGRFGRITLPKDLRERHDIHENTRLIVREKGHQIILIPVASFENPTDALYGSVKLTPPVDDPKELIHKHLHERAREKVP